MAIVPSCFGTQTLRILYAFLREATPLVGTSHALGYKHSRRQSRHSILKRRQTVVVLLLLRKARSIVNGQHLELFGWGRGRKTGEQSKVRPTLYAMLCYAGHHTQESDRYIGTDSTHGRANLEMIVVRGMPDVSLSLTRPSACLSLSVSLSLLSLAYFYLSLCLSVSFSSLSRLFVYLSLSLPVCLSLLYLSIVNGTNAPPSSWPQRRTASIGTPHAPARSYRVLGPGSAPACMTASGCTTATTRPRGGRVEGGVVSVKSTQQVRNPVEIVAKAEGFDSR